MRFFLGDKVLCGFVESRKSDPRDEQPKSESWDLNSEKTGSSRLAAAASSFFFGRKSPVRIRRVQKIGPAG